MTQPPGPQNPSQPQWQPGGWGAPPPSYQQPPPGYGPAPGPPQGGFIPTGPRPSRKRHPVRTTVFVISSLIVIVLVAGAALGSSSKPASNHHHHLAASPTPAAVAATTSPAAAPAPLSCSAKITNWADNQNGTTELDAVENDLNQVSQDAGIQDVTAVSADMSTLATDAETVMKNLPPRCVNGLDFNLGLGMGYYAAAALKFNEGDITQSGTDIKTGTSFINKASASIHKYTGN